MAGQFSRGLETKSAVLPGDSKRTHDVIWMKTERILVVTPLAVSVRSKLSVGEILRGYGMTKMPH
jgi:hypothetical protein